MYVCVQKRRRRWSFANGSFVDALVVNPDAGASHSDDVPFVSPECRCLHLIVHTCVALPQSISVLCLPLSGLVHSVKWREGMGGAKEGPRCQFFMGKGVILIQNNTNKQTTRNLGKKTNEKAEF